MREIDLLAGRRICIVSFSELSQLQFLTQGISVLLVNRDAPFDSELIPQIAGLHSLGCDSFLCSGALAERIHDEIDEWFLEHEDAGAEGVVTTLHDVFEPIEDVISLFLEMSESGERPTSIFVHGQTSRDRTMLDILERLVSEKGSSE